MLCETRGGGGTYPGDGAPAKGRQSHQLVGAEPVPGVRRVVVPQPVEVGLPPGEKGGEGAGEGVALAAAPLPAPAEVVHERGAVVAGAVGYVVRGTLLDDGDAAEGAGELLHAVRLLCRWRGVIVEAEGVAEALELDDVGRQHGGRVAPDQVRVPLDDLQRVGVEDDGHAALPGGLDDAGDGVVHEGVAAEAGPDDQDVQARQHGDDGRGYLLGVAVLPVRRALLLLLVLPHEGVHHEVGRVRLDDGSGAGRADYMRLRYTQKT